MQRTGSKDLLILLGLATLGLAIAGNLSADEPPAVRSPDEIRAAVDGLRQENVAWRKVQWRTCLIDGLRESRQAGKPLLLWVFIDRPIDDERC